MKEDLFRTIIQKYELSLDGHPCTLSKVDTFDDGSGVAMFNLDTDVEGITPFWVAVEPHPGRDEYQDDKITVLAGPESSFFIFEESEYLSDAALAIDVAVEAIWFHLHEIL